MDKYVFAVEVMDKRESYLISSLEENGYFCVGMGAEKMWEGFRKIYLFSISRTMKNEDIAGLEDGSVVFSRGAGVSCKQTISDKNITHFDYMDDETFVFKNAYLTAECSLYHLISNTECSLRETKMLVLGNGRIGKSMLSILKGLGAHPDCVCFNELENAYARAFGTEGFDLGELSGRIHIYKAIINTVPKVILKGDILRQIDKNCFILDLASAPGGVDQTAAAELELNYKHALGVPGKFAPETAGMFLYESIIKRLKILGYDR